MIRMKSKKRTKKVLQGVVGSVFAVLTLYLVFNAYTGLTYAVELEAGQQGITVDQTELFNLSNSYPGQPAEESKQLLKVKNSGNSDFTCTITSKLRSGDERLFDILKLNIIDTSNDQKIYSGSLGDLEELTLGKIRPRADKTFDMTLELPAEVDNSYQGLRTSFQFDLAASGGSSSGGSDGGSEGSDQDKLNPQKPGENPPVKPTNPTEPTVPVEPSQPIEPSNFVIPVLVNNEGLNNIHMPDTGVPSRLPYYSAGLAAVVVGLFLNHKKK